MGKQKNMSEKEKLTGSAEIELRNCPFCGGAARVKPVQFVKYGDVLYCVDCTKCPSRVYAQPTKEEAARLWNQRQPDEQAVKEIFKQIRKRAVEKSGYVNGDSTLQNQVRGYQMTFALEMIEELQQAPGGAGSGE